MGLMINEAAGDKYVDRLHLAQVPTPERTETWRPIPHIALMESVDAIVRRHGWAIDSERYGLVRDQKKMFGVMTIAYSGNPEYTRCIGIRNSHDKSLCAGITAGVSVLVCSNLCFGGTTVLQRRHTSGIDLDEMVEAAMSTLEDEYLTLEYSIEHLRRIPVKDDHARVLIVRAAELNTIPSCDILPVFQEFKSPSHAEFVEPTMWSLLNAFTEVAHKYTPSRSDLCHRQLTRMFGLDGQPALV